MFQRPLKYLIRQLVAGPGPPGGEISHVLQYGVEHQTGLPSQLILVEELLEERLDLCDLSVEIGVGNWMLVL